MIAGRKLVALIAAGGSGRRMGTRWPKQFISIQGLPILARSVLAFSCVEELDGLLVVAPEDYIGETESLIDRTLDGKARLHLEQVEVIAGGQERQDSVRLGLSHLKSRGLDGDAIVLIHDGARPYLSKKLICRLAAAALKTGAAIPCLALKDTVRTLKETLDREELRAVQTPQAFNFSFIQQVHDRAFAAGYKGTDDASLMEGEFAQDLLEDYGISLTMVEGDYENIKITCPDDLAGPGGSSSKSSDQEGLLEETHRVGIGFDVHKLAEGRPLILGGVEIPHKKGLLGHSDADVLVHAIMDAMLGACSLGDIGGLFPDTADEYKGADSIDLLKKVNCKLKQAGFTLVNIDSVISAQVPKLAPFIKSMKERIGGALGLPSERVSIKATTTEGLGFEGREEGMSARAVCIVKRIG